LNQLFSTAKSNFCSCKTISLYKSCWCSCRCTFFGSSRHFPWF